MISNLNDKDALEILMTSEFVDNYKPSEYKEMLLKYRYFYRMLYAKMERIRDDKQFEIERLLDEVEHLKGRVAQIGFECREKDNIINSMKERRLTLKERIFGKIIQKDEDKGFR
jgi:uncharacterized protein YdcH (DUF465 family)